MLPKKTAALGNGSDKIKNSACSAQYSTHTLHSKGSQPLLCEQSLLQRPEGAGGGGGGQTLSILDTIFDRKDWYLFHVPSKENCTPFIYLQSNFY